MADYTPIFRSQVPDLFHHRIVPIDVALIQTSPPDSHGYLRLWVSVDIVKASAEDAPLVIAQVNSNVPHVQGDGFIPMEDVDFIIPMMNPRWNTRQRQIVKSPSELESMFRV